VIEKGKVKESGSHYDLYKKEEGLYQKLIKLQSTGEIVDND
jgi:ABC-type multidrug transport system fused ATPase/permease subunit